MFMEAAEACVTAKQLADYATASSQPGNPLGAAARTTGDCVAVRLTALPELVPYNKTRVFGRGVLADLWAVEDFYREAGLIPRIEISSADTEGAVLLADQGYVLRSTAVTLSREITVANPAEGPAPRSIEALDDDADDTVYLDVVCRGYELTAGSTQVDMVKCEHRTPGLRRFLSIDDGRPVAAGALFIDGSTALLAGAATLRADRRHGHQTSLIRRRIEEARRAACSDVVVTAAPSSESHANLARLGFAEVHARQLWELPPS